MPPSTPAAARALRALTRITPSSSSTTSAFSAFSARASAASPLRRSLTAIHHHHHHRHHRIAAAARTLTTTAPHRRSHPPVSHDRGPPSSEETQTDFDKLDVLANMPAPTTAIDATFDDGFALNSGLHVAGMCGVLLVAGDAFKWRPWVRETTTTAVGDGGEKGGRKEKKKTLRDARGMWECDRAAWGALELVWPKPDLLIIGTGGTVVPVSPTTRKHINDLGIRLEVSDTRNAAAQFNLLATERGVQQVAAALVPIGWDEAR